MSHALNNAFLAISRLPSGEQRAAFHVANLFAQLQQYATDFGSALSLSVWVEAQVGIATNELGKLHEGHATAIPLREKFEADKKIRDTRRVLSSWSGIANRDAVMSIWHFSKTLNALGASGFKEAPTLSARVDHGKIKFARREFRRCFPHTEEARNAAAHSAEEVSTQDRIDKNSASGPIAYGALSAEKGARVMLSGVQLDSDMVFSHKGKIVGNQLSQKSLDYLNSIVRTVDEAFQLAAEASLTAIPQVSSNRVD